MKYTKDILDRYGMKISIINEEATTYLTIRHDSDFSIVEGQIHPFVYFLSPSDVEDLKHNFDKYSYIIDNIIDKHLIARKKYNNKIRKKKLQILNEI